MSEPEAETPLDRMVYDAGILPPTVDGWGYKVWFSETGIAQKQAARDPQLTSRQLAALKVQEETLNRAIRNA